MNYKSLNPKDFGVFISANLNLNITMMIYSIYKSISITGSFEFFSIPLIADCVKLWTTGLKDSRNLLNKSKSNHHNDAASKYFSISVAGS